MCIYIGMVLIPTFHPTSKNTCSFLSPHMSCSFLCLAHKPPHRSALSRACCVRPGIFAKIWGTRRFVGAVLVKTKKNKTQKWPTATPRQAQLRLNYLLSEGLTHYNHYIYRYLTYLGGQMTLNYVVLSGTAANAFDWKTREAKFAAVAPKLKAGDVWIHLHSRIYPWLYKPTIHS